MDSATRPYPNITMVPGTTPADTGPQLSFVAILTIMMVVGTMFGVTIAVIILVSLWPKKKKRRTENIPLQTIDGIYAELDNKSVSTTLTRVTGDYSDFDFENASFHSLQNASINSMPNGAAGAIVYSNGERRSTNTNKKVRFSDHQVEISGFDEPNGRPRSKLYIDVF